MWPNEFAQMMVSIFEVDGQAAGLVVVFSLFFWYGMLVAWSLVMGAAGWALVRDVKRLIKNKGNGKEWWS